MESIPKILIVEDNAIVAADIKARIQRMGYRVTQCVTRGQSAIDSVESAPPNLILMDIKLKGEMSGIEAASSIRTNHDIPIIYLTSYTDEATLERAKLTDPFGYIVKPFEDKELRTVIEISLHKHKMERQLKESEQWLKTTLTSIGDGVITTDMEGCVTFMNPVAEQLTGWTFEEAAGSQVHKIFNIINEETRELVENPVTKVIETGQIIGLANHTLLIAKDGREMPIKDSGSPIVLNDNENIGVVLVFQDDTESRVAEKKLKESEEKFKKLFEFAPLPYQALDENGKFLEVNQTWLEIMGYEKEEVRGRLFSDFLDPAWKKQFEENFSNFKSIGEVLGVQFEMKKKDGTYITVQFDGKISKDQAGKFLQTHCVFKNVTEEVRLQKQIEAQEKVLIQSQKLESIGTLAGGIAHDFNNILSAIIGFSELAKDSIPPDHSAQKDLDVILASSDRAADLVQQILAFSRKSTHNLQSLMPHLIVKEALRMLRSSLPTTLAIEEEIDADCGSILADPTNVHQIVLNLCTNAFHAMENESGALHISLQRKNIRAEDISEFDVSPGQFIVLSVRDTGLGMDKETVGRIFEPYFTTKGVGKGTGLGLAVIHGIVKDYKGFIEVESELGRGSTFRVYFPVTEDFVSVQENVEKESLPVGNERILIVDDEDIIINLQQKTLELLGYTVTATTKSREAVEKFCLNPNQFDLIITDQTMPALPGFELAKQVLEIRPDMPIILCTGYSSMITEKEALAIGIKKYIRKPIDRSSLANVVRQVLDGNLE